MALVALIAAPAAASPLSTVDLAALRAQAAAAVIDCVFTGCDAGDFNDDGQLSAADLTQTRRIDRADPAAYRRITVEGDPSQSGIFDASIVFPGGASTGWMAYSGVDYLLVDGILVRDVTTRIATSDDQGESWRLHDTVSAPAPATITAPSTDLCGQPRCNGRMISEVPFLLDDPTDPDPTRRFKLFTHRYFLYPPAQPSGQDTQYHLGSINLRTASSLAGPWSADTPLLGWDLTPPEVQAAVNVNRLGTVMQSCLALSEGGGHASAGVLDVVFLCPYVDTGSVSERIVLLRSTDHAHSFTFVATLLEAQDAVALGADGFSAPSLLTDNGRTYLLATPVAGSGGVPPRYAGCVVIAIPDRVGGRVERDRAGGLLFRRLLPTTGGRFGGACASYRGPTAGGIVMSQLFAEPGTVDPFRLFDVKH